MKTNKSVLFGHTVISFDCIVNGLLTGMMAPLFFSQQDPTSQLLLSYASYIALYISGPFGGIIFGRIGDKLGRKKSLLISISGIGIPVLIIGILPTYRTIGTIAPIALILCRIIQGFFSQIEYAGVIIHAIENKKISKNDHLTKTLAFGIVGGLFGAIICFFISDETQYGWRIPYIIGALGTFLIFISRRNILETEQYIELKEQKKVSQYPFSDIIKRHKLEVCVATLISSLYVGGMASSMIFGNSLFQQSGKSHKESMMFFFYDLLWSGISIIIAGKLSQKFGCKKILIYGTVAMACAALPLCFLISSDLTFVKIYTYMICMTFLTATIVSAGTAYIGTLFPVSCRYSGFSLSESIGSILGSSTPFMMLYFSSKFHSNTWCSLWLYILIVPTLICVYCMEKKRKKC